MIQPICVLTPRASGVRFNGQDSASKNPVNRSYEKKLAILNASGFSLALGAITTVVARSYTASWKSAMRFGLGAAFMSMIFICPKFLYKAGINSYKSEKEIDVFAKEKEVQKKLLNDVDEAIENHSNDLNSKIDNYSKTKSAKTY